MSRRPGSMTFNVCNLNNTSSFGAKLVVESWRKVAADGSGRGGRRLTTRAVGGDAAACLERLHELPRGPSC